MAASVQIDEQNGAGAGSPTTNITNSNMGNVDAANLVAATYPVTPGDYTYAKYQRLQVTNMGGSSATTFLSILFSTIRSARLITSKIRDIMNDKRNFG